MNQKKKEISLLQKIFYLCAFTVLIGAFIFLGTRNYHVKEILDNEAFASEFKTVNSDNIFQVFTSYEALNFLERDTGLIFLGFPENEWSSVIAELLNQVSKETNYSIAYYNFYQDRLKKHDNYLGIVRELDDYLLRDDNNQIELHAPTVVAVIHGEVVFFDDDTSYVSKKESIKSYWTQEKRSEKLNSYREIIEILKRS